MSFQKAVCCYVSIAASDCNGWFEKADLVTITPPEVLGADVLVRVFGPLRAGVLVLLVRNVLPVGVPPQLGVDSGNDDAGDSDAAVVSTHLLEPN